MILTGRTPAVRRELEGSTRTVFGSLAPETQDGEVGIGIGGFMGGQVERRRVPT